MSSRLRGHLAVAVATAVATAAAFAIPALADDSGAGEQSASIEAVPAEAVAVPASAGDAGNAGEAGEASGANCGWAEAEAVPFEPGDEADPADGETVDPGDGGDASNANNDADGGVISGTESDGPIEGVATLCATAGGGDGDQMDGELMTAKAVSVDCGPPKP
jgi:hypothetical protein